MATDRWKNRRRIIYGTLVYCAGMVGFIAYSGNDTALLQQISLGLITLAGGVIGAYVFGAAWDDKNHLPIPPGEDK